MRQPLAELFEKTFCSQSLCVHHKPALLISLSKFDPKAGSKSSQCINRKLSEIFFGFDDRQLSSRFVQDALYINSGVYRLISLVNDSVSRSAVICRILRIVLTAISQLL